jgi:hypothetical protein
MSREATEQTRLFYEAICARIDEGGEHDEPLSIRMRSDWTAVGEPLRPNEYEILLSIRDPMVRIIGKIDEHYVMSSAQLQNKEGLEDWQDYGGPFDEEILLAYVWAFHVGPRSSDL